MDAALRSGFSESQLHNVNLDAILMAFTQDPTEASMVESENDKTKMLDAFPQKISPVKSLRAPSQDMNNNGHLGEELRQELRPASPKLNGHQDSQHRTATVAPPLSAQGDGVMPIAIVGMSCRFPGGASDIGKFWEMVSEGRSAWSKVPESRFNVDAFYHPDSNRTDSVSS